MKNFLAAFAMLAISYDCTVAQAQSQPPAQLEYRFNACISNKNCSTQARLQIIQEENDEMNNRFQKVHEACADANFQNCINQQKSDVDAWYRAQNNMQKLMQSMQTQGLQEKEPAAGGDPSSSNDLGKKSFWRRIWPFGGHE